MIPLVSSLNNNESIAAVFGSLSISPLWWALALGCGLGGNGTLVGSSAGIVGTGISEKNGYRITFNRFLRVGFPFMIITVASGSVILLIDILIRLPSGT